MSNKNLWQRIKEKNESALDPIDRISEVLFGLIMVLSFTGSISVVSDGRAEISELLWAALGCNLAWGIIDAVFYLMGTIFSRGHGLSVLKKLKLTKDKETSRNLLKDELPLYLSAILKPEEIDSLNERLIKLESLPTKKIISSADLRAAFLIFFLYLPAHSRLLFRLLFSRIQHVALPYFKSHCIIDIILWRNLSWEICGF